MPDAKMCQPGDSSPDEWEGIAPRAAILAFPARFAGKEAPARRPLNQARVDRAMELITPCLEHVLWERENAQAFEALARRIVGAVIPETPLEIELTAKLIVAWWRLYRLEKIETATLTKGDGNVQRVLGEFTRQNRAWQAAMLGAQRLLQVIERRQNARHTERWEQGMMDQQA